MIPKRSHRISGTIKFRSCSYYLQTPEGSKWKIHFSEKQRLNLGDEHIGCRATAETALENVPPIDFDGFCKNGSVLLAAPLED